MTEPEKTPSLIPVKDSEDVQSDESRQIVELLEQAKEQLLGGNLIAPKGNNALETYRKIISIDPENQEAFEGINELKQQLMSASAKEENSTEDASIKKAPEELEPTEEIVLPEWKLPDYDSILNTESIISTEPETNVEPESKTLTIPPRVQNTENNQAIPLPAREFKWPTVAGVITIAGVVAALLLYQNPDAIEKLKEIPQLAMGWSGKNNQTESDQQSVQPSSVGITVEDTIDTVVNDETPTDAHTVASTVDSSNNDSSLVPSPETDESSKEIEAMLMQSRNYLQTNRLITPKKENAFFVLNQILEHDSEHAEALLGMEMLKQKLFDKATIAQNTKDWEIARNQLGALIQIEPENQQYKDAITNLIQLQKQHEQVEALLIQGESHLQSGQNDSPTDSNALSVFNMVLALEPNNQQAIQGIAAVEKQFLELATAAYDRQEWDVVKSYLQQVLAINSTNTDAQEILEQVAVDKAKLSELNDLLERAQKYLADGRLIEPVGDNASFLFLQVLQQNPDNNTATQGLNTITDTLLSKASDAQEENDWNNAVIYLNAAQRFRPDNAEIQKAITIVNEKQEETRKVAALSTEAEEKQGQVDTLLAQGQANLEAGQYTSPESNNSLSLFNNVLAIDPDNQQAIQGIAAIEKQVLVLAIGAKDNQKWGEATKYLHQLLVINPANSKAQETLVEVAIGNARQNELEDQLTRAQQYLTDERLIQPVGDNATFLFLQVLRNDPENEAAKQGIEAVTTKLILKAQQSQKEGNWDGARYYLDAAQRIQPENDDLQQMILVLTETQKKTGDIASLMVQAQKILETSPAGGDADKIALEQFNQVLSLDAKNEDAVQGIEGIKKRFLTAAKQDVENKQWNTARASLNAVLSIDSQNQEASELKELLNHSEREAQQINAWLKDSRQQLDAGDIAYDEYEDVYILIGKVLEREPNNSQALLNRRILIEKLRAGAHVAHSVKDWDGAQKYYEFLLRINSADERAQASLANLINEKEQSIELENLLALGDKYILENRLTEPDGDNAFIVYKQALNIDPKNLQAKNGIEKVQTKLLELANDAQKQEQWGTANSYLNTLLTINPQHSSARAALEKLTDIRADKTQKVAENTEARDTNSVANVSDEPISEQELLEILVGE